MARRPRDLGAAHVTFIDEGLSDAERENAMATWLDEFDAHPAVEVGVRASDTLAEVRGEGEV